MTPRYQHTQTGYLVIISLTLLLLFIAGLSDIYDSSAVAVVVLIILGVSLGLVSTLTIIIEEEKLKIKFGVGIIQKKFLLKDIVSCQVVKNPWYYGWGIHLTPHGWLFNVSGSDAIEIKMGNGKQYRIGTDVPDELNKVIQQFIKR